MSLEADRVIEFIETFLTLGKSFLGQPFELLEFQKQTIHDIYKEDPFGQRLRRSYLLGLPRKNGKSQLGAAIGLYHLIADTRDKAPEVISAAGDRDQAKLVFNEAKRMVEMSPALSEVCKVYRNEIRCSINGGIYKVVSSDAGLQQGLNPSMVIFDELHIYKNSDLLDALTLGSATRNSPLILIITTAGFDMETPLGRLYQQGLRIDGRIINGEVMEGEDKRTDYGMTWWGPTLEEMTDVDFNHKNEEIWERYNPAWAIMPHPIAEFTASSMSTHESAFIRYKLNGWTSSGSAFLPAGAWAACINNTDRKIQPREEVILGFDGAWRGDSTALVAIAVSDLHLEVLGHWEAPPNDPDWRTPAWEVEHRILEALDKYTVRELAADPWRFEQSLLKLQEEHGAPLVEYPTNTPSRMIPATGTFYQTVMDVGISHDGDPALARHLANAVLRETPKGALVTKETKNSRRHIDIAIAAIIALDRALKWREEPTYNDSLLLIL